MSKREKKTQNRKTAEKLAVTLLQQAKDEHWPFFECYEFTFVRLAQWIVFERDPHDVASDYWGDDKLRYDLDEYLEESHWIDIVRVLEGFIAGGRPVVMKTVRRRLQLDGFERPPFRVYSPWPAEAHIPETAINMKHGTQTSRDDYIELPWTFQDLLGSTWRYVWTGTLATVTNIQLDRFCEPHLVIRDSYRSKDDLGLWHNRKADDQPIYVVDNAVRMDHLAPDRQLTWYTYRLSKAQRDLSQLDAKNDKWQLEFRRRDVTNAMNELQAFEEQHGIQANVVDVMNEAIKDGGQSRQLVLF